MRRLLTICVFATVSHAAWGHKNKSHSAESPNPTATTAPEPSPVASAFAAPDPKTLAQSASRSAYAADVEPIFKTKCFDCHSNKTRYPWYYEVPIVRQLINHDIEEAREHMDMSEGFPFQGHGTPAEDLAELKSVIEDNEMPPLLYVLAHRGSSLTEGERRIILNWIEASRGAFAP
jgi:hypothetical protein